MGNDSIDLRFKKMIKRIIEQIGYVKNISEYMPLDPQYIHIEPTNACNLRCIHCHHHRGKDGRPAIKRKLGIMDYQLYKKIIDEVAPLLIPITLDTQGEPTLHPKFIDMVRYSHEKGIYTSVITNATRLNQSLSEALLDQKLDRIVFSFDSVDKDLYERIRIRSKFERTLANILQFIKLNHKKGHPTHICMSMVSQEMTINHIHEYKEFFKRLPVDKIFVNPLLNLAGLSPLKNQIAMDSMQEYVLKNRPICRVPWESLTFNWDGEVGPCPVDVNVVYSLGNIKNYSLQDLWNNYRMQNFRRAHLENKYVLVEENGALCGTCNAKLDDDYNLRKYESHAVEAIYRNSVHFAHSLTGKVAAACGSE